MYNRYSSGFFMLSFYEFIDYVFSFYGADGLYDQGRTKEQIAFATLTYLDEVDARDDDFYTWGNGDSLDRERVRDFMNDLYGPSSKIYPTVADVPDDVYHNWCYPDILSASASGDI